MPFAAAIYLVVVRVGEDESIVKGFSSCRGGWGGGDEESLTCVQKATRDMILADDSCILSKSVDGLLR